MGNMHFDKSQIAARFAVVSDLHIAESPIAKSNQKFRRALDLLYPAMDGRMDALVIAGDITDWATPIQVQQFKTIIEEKLKPETVLFAAIGNHDVHDNMNTSHLGGMPFYEALGRRMYEGASEEEMAVGNYHRVIQGLHFLTLGHHDYHSGKSEQADLEWLRGQLEQAVLDTPDQPVFLALHPVLKNTIFGSDEGTYWHTDNLKGLLHQFPQVVVFSGHLHFPLNDERIIYQDGFTAVGTAAVYYGSLHAQYKEHKYMEVVTGFEPYDCHIVSQALIVEVDANGTTRLRRFDLTNNTEIKTPWIVPVPSTEEQPYTKAVRCAKNTAPWFEKGAAVKITSLSDSRLTLSFPAAQDDDLVYSYELCFTPREGGDTRTIMTYSDFYRHPQVQEMSKTVTRTITKKELECNRLDSAYAVTVRAMDSFGAWSSPIVNHPETDAVRTKECIPFIETLMNHTVCHRLYDFNFWEKGRKNMGDITDASGYLGDSDGAGTDYTVESTAYGADGGAAMKVTMRHPTDLNSCRTLSIKLFHPDNPYYTQTYPHACAFSFFVDAAHWNGNLKMYPMIYEQDYTLDDKPAGLSLFAPKSVFPYQIEQDGYLLTCEGHGDMTLPPNYVGRVYLPLTKEAVETIWMTKDVNGKFDGRDVSRLVFVLTSLSDEGSYFILDDIGIHESIESYE